MVIPSVEWLVVEVSGRLLRHASTCEDTVADSS